MDKIQLTPEIFEQLMHVKSIEELLKVAKEKGISVTEEQAEDFFKKYLAPGEISDDELDHVTGGGCFDPKCFSCGGTLEYIGSAHSPGGSSIYHYICTRCGSRTSANFKM